MRFLECLRRAPRGGGPSKRHARCAGAAVSAELRLRLRIERCGNVLRVIHDDSGKVLYSAQSTDELLLWLESDGRSRHPAKNLRAAIELGEL
jgi:hypothetical protein